jgi:hypothetical protein
MEEDDYIVAKWAQADVETLYSLLNIEQVEILETVKQ